MRHVRLSFLWYSVARGRQQENSHRQVGSARASPLAFSLVAGQPRQCSDFPKNGEECEIPVFCCYGTRSSAASSRRNIHRQVGSARASPLALNPMSVSPVASLHQWSSIEAVTLPFFFFNVNFFFWLKEDTQLARQVQQQRTQVVCSNEVGRSRLAQMHSCNGPRTYGY